MKNRVVSRFWSEWRGRLSERQQILRGWSSSWWACWRRLHWRRKESKAKENEELGQQTKWVGWLRARDHRDAASRRRRRRVWPNCATVSSHILIDDRCFITFEMKRKKGRKRQTGFWGSLWFLHAPLLAVDSLWGSHRPLSTYRLSIEESYYIHKRSKDPLSAAVLINMQQRSPPTKWVSAKCWFRTSRLNSRGKPAFEPLEPK